MRRLGDGKVERLGRRDVVGAQLQEVAPDAIPLDP